MRQDIETIWMLVQDNLLEAKVDGVVCCTDVRTMKTKRVMSSEKHAERFGVFATCPGLPFHSTRASQVKEVKMFSIGKSSSDLVPGSSLILFSRSF
jgi:hypothetical protein